MSSILDTTQTTDALSKIGTNNLQRKRNIKIPLQRLSMKEFFTTIHKKSQKSVNFSYSRNYTICERTGEMEVLKLKNWDIENLIHIKTESDLLYSSLNDFYKKNKNYDKLEQLNSYQKIIDTSNVDMKNILKSKSKISKNKILDNLIKKNHEEQGTILLNSIAKTKNKFNLTSMENKKQNNLAQNFGFESQTLNSVSNNNNLNSQFYRRVIKEKVGQENFSRQELMQITLKYMDKKNERIEKESLLSQIFIDINNLTNKFNEEKNKIKIEILNNQEFIEKMKREGKISKEESMLLTRQKAIERVNLERKIKEKYKNYLI